MKTVPDTFAVSNSYPFMQGLSLLLGFAFGALVGYVPLWWSRTDPFDEPISYAFWFIGLSLVAMTLSFSQPTKVWRYSIVVGMGFPTAVTLDMILNPDTYQLPPLTLLFSLLIGMTASVVGVYCGRMFEKGKRGQAE